MVGSHAMGRKHHPDRRGAGSSAAGGGEDHARFSAVVLPLLHEAYALARSLTGNRADAEDVVQDACVRAFRAIRGITSDNPRAWLLTIVRNAAFTWLGRNRQPAIVIMEDLEAAERLAPPDARHDETPESALIAKTETAKLEAAIAELPMPFRETLVLREIHGLNYREISAATGVPIGTVMSRLARARARLATSLADRKT
jgi:RNA polymerase sigma-70 factor (ECF subfamily)